MLNRVLSEIGKTQRLAILYELKRSSGLAVKELARRLSMSYMGVKQHCIELERNGYLDAWRNPKPVGRPELVYRLTRKADDVFPTGANAMTLGVLEAADELFGPASAVKLLFLYFRAKTSAYGDRMRGDSPAERAKWLVRLRARDGHLARVETDPLRIVEMHTPFLDVLEKYPELGAVEREMMATLLGARVTRRATIAGGHYECVFTIAS